MAIMKRKYMLMFGIIFYLIFLVVLALIVYYSNDSVLWQEGTWFMAYLIVVQYLFYLSVPVLFFAIIIGIWVKDSEPEKTAPLPNRDDKPEKTAPEHHGINCPNCDRWFPSHAHICPECELPVANMARMSQVKKRFLDGKITREQYDVVVGKLKE